jgi:hypothetical protein
MDISTLTKKPQLIQLSLDDEDTVAIFGEPVNFWMMDNLGITTYFNFYKLQQEQNDDLLYALLRQLILTADGKPAIAADEMLPVNLVVALLVKITEYLGKSNAKMSTQPAGTQPN